MGPLHADLREGAEAATAGDRHGRAVHRQREPAHLLEHRSVLADDLRVGRAAAQIGGQAGELLAEREAAALLYQHRLAPQGVVDLSEQLPANDHIADEDGEHDRDTDGSGGDECETAAQRHESLQSRST